MKKNLFVLLVLFLSASCTNDEKEELPVVAAVKIPQVFDVDEKDISVSPYDKRQNRDIIQQLYIEAVESDAQLKSIDTRISEIKQIKKDSLEAYQSYVLNNKNYWKSLHQYAQQIKDTALSGELTSFIEAFQVKYSNDLALQNSIANEIKAREQILRDQEILLKIIVTAPMMSNYQQSQLPDLNTLQNVKGGIDTLIKDVKPYTEMNKPRQLIVD